MSLLSKLVAFNIRLSKIFDRTFPCFVAERDREDLVLFLVREAVRNRDFYSVLEVGGIVRPLLKRSRDYRYDGLDVEHAEQWERLYDNFAVQSIEEPIKYKYDLIVSKSVLEHVRDNKASVTQMYEALRTGGYAIHYLPSKYHPYSLVLRLVGPKWQSRLIMMLRPWTADITGYRTFFDRCSPREMKGLFECAGFETVRTTPIFRASDYFRFCLPCYVVVTLWENICKRLQWEQCCSGFVIVARK
ncbi:MAG: methyltransferase domain-containing protein [Phycisphaerales bacterium]|nr:MAG: methyltransferase domain-containing protein [Phycisphaerales bacterium]